MSSRVDRPMRAAQIASAYGLRDSRRPKTNHRRIRKEKRIQGNWTRSPKPLSKRNIRIERPRLLAITIRVGGRLRVISLLTLSGTEKGHLLRNDLHDFMP